MTKLLNRLKEDWDIYTSEEEKGILSEYAHIGQLVIYGYMGEAFINLFCLNLLIQPTIFIPNSFIHQHFISSCCLCYNSNIYN